MLHHRLAFRFPCYIYIRTIAAPQASVFLGWPEIFLQLSSLLPPAQPVSRIARTGFFRLRYHLTRVRDASGPTCCLHKPGTSSGPADLSKLWSFINDITRLSCIDKNFGTFFMCQQRTNTSVVVQSNPTTATASNNASKGGGGACLQL